MSQTRPELRVVTYMCPSHPIELYELILEVLEDTGNCYTTLQYESRSPGPLNDRPDPFATDKIDLGKFFKYLSHRKLKCAMSVGLADEFNLAINRTVGGLSHRARLVKTIRAFMSVSAYMKLRDRNEFVELLPVTPVFAHQMNVENKPGYFSDIIIHSDKKAHNVNTLLDLRGCTFAYSDEESLSGSRLVLKTLKGKGENASFFGSLLRSGSHISSAQMVLSKQAEWAAVDSTTLLYSKKFMYDGGKEIITLETLGRLPPYPIVVNSRLPAKLKEVITDALLNIHKKSDWKNRFAKFGLIKFESNSNVSYNGPPAQMWASQSEKLNVRYY